MHHVLAIPEILHLIFSYLEADCNARNARVCRQWTDVALDFVWEEVNPSTFRSLAPMDIDGTGALTFTHHPTADEWRHFLRNAARVRMWTDSHFNDVEGRLSQDAATDIFVTCTSTTVFPNLRRVYTGATALHRFLLSGTVHNLGLMVTALNNTSSFQSAFTANSDLTSVCLPNVEHIFIHHEQLEDDETIPAYDEELIVMLQALQNLKTVRLPLFCLRSEIIDVLSFRTSLKSISVDLELPLTVYDRDERAGTHALFSHNHPLTSGAFSALCHISFSSPTIADARSFLTQPAFPAHNISFLWIHTAEIPTPAAVDNLLTSLSSTCRSLSTLSVIFEPLVYSESSNLATVSAIEGRHLRSLTNFRNLTAFIIAHPYPISITNEELADISSGLPNLTELKLNPWPIVTKSTSLTLSALVPLSEHCARLKELGLYVDATAPLPHSSPSIASPQHEWRLRGLYLGRSPISISSDAQRTTYPQIAKFLASFLRNPFPTWIWSDENSFSSINEEGGLDEDWLTNLRDHQDLENYEEAWRSIEVMTNLVVEGRESLREMVMDGATENEKLNETLIEVSRENIRLKEQCDFTEHWYTKLAGMYKGQLQQHRALVESLQRGEEQAGSS